MSKGAIAGVAIVVLLFLGIARWKSSNGVGADPAADVDDSLVAERNRIRQFWALYRSATAHRVAGRLNAAAAAYRAALELDPTHEDALYYLGNTLFALNETPEAEDAWQRLVAVNPRSSRGYVQLGTLHACPERPEVLDRAAAEREFARAHALNKEETGPIARLGELALLSGDFRRAGDHFDAVLGSNEASREAYYFTGYLAWKDGDAARAATWLARAVRRPAPGSAPPDSPGEGDTKGASANMRPQAICKIIPIDLARLPPEAATSPAAYVEPEYRKLRALLAEIVNLSSSLRHFP